MFKIAGRIEALFTLHVLAALVLGLPERELRLTIRQLWLDQPPLCLEQRNCRRPTTEQVLRLFGHVQRHRLTQAGQTVQLFAAGLTDLQRQILNLSGVAESAYCALG